jgi:hypothetical protein
MDAYSALLSAYQAFTTAVSPLTGPSRGRLREHLGELNSTGYQFVQTQSRIRVVGPATVEEACTTYECPSLTSPLHCVTDVLAMRSTTM